MLRVIVLTVAVLALAAHGGSRYGESGCVEIGGALGISGIFSGPDATTIFAVQCAPDIFPANMFFLSPNAALQYLSDRGYSETDYSAGLSFGFACNLISPIVFISTGIQGMGSSVRITDFGNGDAGGFAIPIATGIKIPINESVLITAQVTYTYADISNRTLNTLMFGVGVSGFKISHIRAQRVQRQWENQ